MIFGDIDSFLTPELLEEYDVVTIAQELDVLYLRGQFTFLKNNEFTKSLYIQTSKELREGLSKRDVYGMEETLFSLHVINNQTITFATRTVQKDDERRFQNHLLWDHGQLFSFLRGKIQANEDVPHSSHFPLMMELNTEGCNKDDITHERSCAKTLFGQFEYSRKRRGADIMMSRALNKYPVAFYHFLHSKYWEDVEFGVNYKENLWNVIVDMKRRKLLFLPQHF